MQGRLGAAQEEMFSGGSLMALIPEDHLFVRVRRAVSFEWIHEEVKRFYCQDNGRPGIDPEAALRLMLAGFFEGIVSDRKLMRRAQTDLAFRWFAGYGVNDPLPDHSSLTRIRQRWGQEFFLEIFRKTVRHCVDAGLVSGEVLHVDASLIRANVSWDSLTTEHVERVVEANKETSHARTETNDQTPPCRKPGRPRTKPPKQKKRSTTDPDATMATSRNDQRLEPSYKQHTAVDDRCGVIVDVAVTTGEANEGHQLLAQIDRAETLTGVAVKTVTADASYAHGANFEALESRNTDAVIPPQKTGRPKRLPLSRFRYDAKNQRVRCPQGKFLHRTSPSPKPKGWRYRSRVCDCRHCPLRDRCLSNGARTRSILITDGYEALLRARRRKARGWDEATRAAYQRHRWRSEGIHGEAKTQHGLRRAIRRGLASVAIQAYLTAAVMNLKRLANHAAQTTPTTNRPKTLFNIVKNALRSIGRNTQQLINIEHARSVLNPSCHSHNLCARNA